MTFSQLMLRVFHPKAEAERCEMREVMSRARAEAEDLTRTVEMSSEDFKKWLRDQGVAQK